MTAPTNSPVSVVSFWLVDPSTTLDPSSTLTPISNTPPTSTALKTSTRSSSSQSPTAPPTPSTTPSHPSFLSSKSGIAFIIAIVVIAVVSGFLVAMARGNRKMRTVFSKGYGKPPKEKKGTGQPMLAPVGPVAEPQSRGLAGEPLRRPGGRNEERGAAGDQRQREGVGGWDTVGEAKRVVPEWGKERNWVWDTAVRAGAVEHDGYNGAMERDVRREFERWR